MPGGRGGRSVLFTAPGGNHFAELAARRGDFTNLVADAKMVPIEISALQFNGWPSPSEVGRGEIC
jgi:hypothetical protein